MYDDNLTIINNYYIKNFGNIRYIFTKNYFSYFEELTYRPICTISYFINYYFFKLNPLGYHITNTLFHTLSSILVYFLILLATKNFLLSLFTSLIFVLHPIQTEVVNAISFREDLMAQAFSLLSILTFVKMMNSSNYKKYLYYAFSLLSFIIGIFSKETALITPFLLILYNFIFIDKSIKETINKKYYYLGFFIILLFYFCITKVILYNPNPFPKITYPGDNIIVTLLTMSKVFIYYLKNLILPIHLYADYVIPLSSSIFEPMVLLSTGIIILIFAGAIILYRKSKVVSFGILYFYIALLPVSNIIIPIGHLMNDRYLYMPCLGFCLILYYLLIKFLKNKKILITTFFIISVFYSSLTIKQNTMWQDEILLWKNVLTRYPDSFNAYNMIGYKYASKFNYDEGLRYLNKALQLNPNLADAYNNRGLIYEKKGLLDNALSDFNKAIELNPNYTEVYNNRGVVYRKKGLFNKALVDINKAIQLNPRLAEVYVNRAAVYYKKGLIEKALRDSNKAIQLNPRLAEAYNERGLIYDKKGLVDKAMHDFNKAIELNPKLLGSYINRGVIYYRKGLLMEALKDFNMSIKLNPSCVECYYNRGAIYGTKKLLDDAIKDFNKTIQLNPKFVEAYNSRGIAYHTKGQLHKALHNFNKAIELNPNYAEAYNNRGVIFTKLGKKELAIRDFQKAASLGLELAKKNLWELRRQTNFYLF